MTSFIITGKNNSENNDAALRLCDQKKIDQFDITLVTSDKESLGIEVIKKLQEKIILRPLRSKDKAVIIPNAQLLTLPAQNALLKLLEEPPEHTYLFLLTNNVDTLLGTIQSRCQIIKIADHASEISDDDRKKLLDDYNELINQTIGYALKTAERMAKEKDQTIIYLQSLLRVCRITMLEQIAINKTVGSVPAHINSIQSTINTLQKTNTSPRLTLEHLFLNLRG